jgi:hypothetical protein
MSSAPPPPVNPQLTGFSKVINTIYCAIKPIFESIGNIGVSFGAKVSSYVGPIITGSSQSLQNLDQVGQMKLVFMFLAVLLIVFLLAASLTIGTFSNAFGIVVIVILVCILAIPSIYNLVLRTQTGSDQLLASSGAGYTSQIFVMALFVIALVVYMYLDPLAKLSDYVSGYSVSIILITFLTMVILSYNKYLFNQYAGVFVIFIAFIGLIYFWNPFSFLTNHVDISSLAIISIGTAIIIAMLVYQNDKLYKNAAANASLSGNASLPSALSADAINTINYFMGIVVLILMLYGIISIEQSYASNSSVVSWGLLIAILFTMGAIAYKFIDKSSILDKYPIIRLVINVILYLPCIYVSKLEKILKVLGIAHDEAGRTPKSVWILLASELVFIGAYLVFPYLHKYYQRKVYIGDKEKGLLLVNEPIDTRSENLITSYAELNEPDEGSETLKINYHYALSFWFNIDAMPPSTGSQYTKFTSIFNYGEKPNIKYRASTNTLIITTEMGKDNEVTKQIIENLKTEKAYDDEQIAQHFKEIGIELDEFDNRVVFKTRELPMQRWNHLVINYAGGTLDIFLNGELVQSSIEIAPYVVNDSLYVGSSDGISGGICSLIYFKQTQHIMEIQKMYANFKNENPPIFINDPTINIKKK